MINPFAFIIVILVAYVVYLVMECVDSYKERRNGHD